MQFPFRSKTATIAFLSVLIMTAFLVGGVVALVAFDRLSAPSKEKRQPTVTSEVVDITATPDPVESTVVPTALQPTALSTRGATLPVDLATSIPANYMASGVGATPTVGMPSGKASPSNGTLPDLVVLSSSGIVGGVLKRGQPATMIVEGANRGEGNAAGVVVKVEIQLKVLTTFATLYVYPETVPAVKAGETIRREVTGTLPEYLMPGTYRVIVVVDPDNTVQESNEGNNSLSYEVSVR